MVTIALRLDPETRLKLEHLARLSGRPRSFLVAEAVRRFVDAELAGMPVAVKREKPEPPDAPDAPERWNIIV